MTLSAAQWNLPMYSGSVLLLQHGHAVHFEHEEQQHGEAEHK